MMGTLDVNPADLIAVSGRYGELQALLGTLSPQAAEEVNRVIDTHGKMGYPVAVGILCSLARSEAAVNRKMAAFGEYAQRFTEHAATYSGQDAAAASSYTMTGAV